jgi:hypothetical protein
VLLPMLQFELIGKMIQVFMHIVKPENVII